VLAQLSIRFAVVYVSITVPPVVGAHDLARAIVREAIEPGCPRILPILLINHFDHAVEPFANRLPASARGGASSFAHLWTETSQIPWTTRFHNHRPNPMRSKNCPLSLANTRLTEDLVFCP
jgi:hypothetical protein